MMISSESLAESDQAERRADQDDQQHDGDEIHAVSFLSGQLLMQPACHRDDARIASTFRAQSRTRRRAGQSRQFVVNDPRSS